jgi:hypothetical protein
LHELGIAIIAPLNLYSVDKSVKRVLKSPNNKKETPTD